MSGDPFKFDAALDQALANDVVPDLSAGFADRVVAATSGRAEPLPRSRSVPSTRWKAGRRIVVGGLAAGALATAAAATGVLGELGVELPTPQEVWSNLIGQEPEAPTPPSTSMVPPTIEEPVTIEGPIDSPEELEEAFRQIDARRALRRENRRNLTDRRIDARMEREIERRQQQGLPIPTQEQQDRLRNRIEQFRSRSDERREGRLEQRRDEMREVVENGGELTREDFIRGQRGSGSGTPVADRIERFRQLPPDERRARIQQWRQRRGAARGDEITAEAQEIAPYGGLVSGSSRPGTSDNQMSEYEALASPDDLSRTDRGFDAIGQNTGNISRPVELPLSEMSRADGADAQSSPTDIRANPEPISPPAQPQRQPSDVQPQQPNRPR